MSLKDELVAALKRALGDRVAPVVQKAAEVMDEFEAGVELARQQGQALVRVAREAEAARRRAQDEREARQRETVTVEAEEKK